MFIGTCWPPDIQIKSTGIILDTGLLTPGEQEQAGAGPAAALLTHPSPDSVVLHNAAP